MNMKEAERQRRKREIRSNRRETNAQTNDSVMKHWKRRMLQGFKGVSNEAYNEMRMQ